MVLTARRAADFITNVLGGTVSAEIGVFDVLNQAGEQVEASRNWVYLKRSMRSLAFRAPVVATSGTWVNSTQTLTLAAAFATYTYVPGDEVVVTISDVESGTYKITGKSATVPDDAITVDCDLADGTWDFTIKVPRIQLPTDFGRIISVYGVNGFTRTSFPTSTSELMRIDTLALVQNNFVTGYALEWNSATAKSQPVATLLLWPEPAVAEFDALSAVYLRNWPTITSDDDIIPIPPYMENLYLQYVRAFAAGYDAGVDVMERVQAQGVALAAVRKSDTYMDAAKRDSAGQADMGKSPKRAVRVSSRSPGYDPLSNVRPERLFQD